MKRETKEVLGVLAILVPIPFALIAISEGVMAAVVIVSAIIAIGWVWWKLIHWTKKDDDPINEPKKK